MWGPTEKPNTELAINLTNKIILLHKFRGNPLEVFIRKVVLKICSKFTGELPCRSVISINTSGGLFLSILKNAC